MYSIVRSLHSNQIGISEHVGKFNITQDSVQKSENSQKIFLMTSRSLLNTISQVPGAGRHKHFKQCPYMFKDWITGLSALRIIMILKTRWWSEMFVNNTSCWLNEEKHFKLSCIWLAKLHRTNLIKILHYFKPSVVWIFWRFLYQNLKNFVVPVSLNLLEFNNVLKVIKLSDIISVLKSVY